MRGLCKIGQCSPCVAVSTSAIAIQPMVMHPRQLALSRHSSGATNWSAVSAALGASKGGYLCAGGSAGESSEDMMLVGRLGDSLFAMPAPHGHGSTGIAEPRIVDYPMNIDGCLGDEVHHPTTSPALAVAHQHHWCFIQVALCPLPLQDEPAATAGMPEK